MDSDAPYQLFSSDEIIRAGGDVYGDEQNGDERNLAARSIKAAWGMSLFGKQQAGAALYWLSEADSDLVPELAKRSLQRLVKDDSGSSAGSSHDEHADQDLESLLQYVEEDGCGGKEVDLMRCYIRLEKLLKIVHRTNTDTFDDAASAQAEAASLLRQLLQPSLLHRDTAAPRLFRRKLLLHTVTLIEMQGPALFSSNDIFLFMQALQDIELSYRTSPATKESALDLQKIRLALARGLANSFQYRPVVR